MNQARRLAFQSLLKSAKNASYSNLEMDATLRSASLSEEDRSLYTGLYLGVIEKKITLDYLLSRISTTPLNQMEPEPLCILELSAYQILYLDRIPDHAAIFEAGELAKAVCPHALSLVNAVLRRISREKDAVLSLLDQPGKKGLALKYGYPRYLVGLWQSSYGKDACLAIMKAQNERAPLTLRVNTLKTDLDAYSKLLEERGITHHKNALSKHAITLEEAGTPTALPGFEEGLFFVQDAAAGHAVDRLGAMPGERILDLCAAPGGKSFGAAMDMNGCGTILSCELHPTRLPLIEDGAKRLGISILGTRAADSRIPVPEHKSGFDRVICDVPCSGYGVIAKKPDIRHKAKEEADALPEIQLAILKTAAHAVKPGGRIVYSTCTLNPAENEAVCNRFLAENPHFRRQGEMETIFPKAGENDGFFVDCLEKIHD